MGRKKEKQNTIEFRCKISKMVFQADDNDFKIYSATIDTEQYPNVHIHPVFHNVTLKGLLPILARDCTYTVKAIEEWDSRRSSYSYKVVNLQADDMTNADDMYTFLKEIINMREAQTLYKEYPNIVEMIMNGRDKEVDLQRLPGIKEKKFARIREKVIANYGISKLVIEFGSVFPFGVLKKLYDEYVSIDGVKQALKNEPYYALCKLPNIGFVRADELLLKLDQYLKESHAQGKPVPFLLPDNLMESKDRCMACMLYLLMRNEMDGNTVMNLKELYVEVQSLAPSCAHHFSSALKCPEIMSNKKRNLVCLTSTYQQEKEVATMICKALYDNPKAFKLDELFVRNHTRDDYRTVDGCLLSEQQQKALDNLCDYPISILNGYAGSGKSFSTKAIVDMCKENHIWYSLVAPTGRAAKILKEYSSSAASTIHKLLGSPIWTVEEVDANVVIVDESSMCDLNTFWHLLKAIDFGRTHLLIIGDNAQLPSVGCGNILHDLLVSKVIPTVTLDKIFRYSDGGLMKVATDTRDCLSYLPEDDYEKKEFGSQKDYVFINVEDNEILNKMQATYKEMLVKYRNPLDVQVLTAYRKGDYGSIAINNLLQKIANKKSLNDKNAHRTVKDISFYENDIVLQIKNNYNAVRCTPNYDVIYDPYAENEIEPYERVFIANGEIGTIQKIDSQFVYILFDDVIVRYRTSDLKDIELGYCITIHKCQGGNIKCPLIISPKSHTYMLSSNLLYVALTRTKNQCIHFGNVKTINRSVRKKNNLQRSTYLSKLLRTYYEHPEKMVSNFVDNNTQNVAY